MRKQTSAKSGAIDALNFSPKLTPKQRRDVLLLRRAWGLVEAHRKKIGDTSSFTREHLSIQAGKTKTAAGHYFRGHSALNVEWYLRFAQYLRLRPQDIWSDWPFKDLTHVTIYGSHSLGDVIAELQAELPLDTEENAHRRKKVAGTRRPLQ